MMSEIVQDIDALNIRWTAEHDKEKDRLWETVGLPSLLDAPDTPNNVPSFPMVWALEEINEKNYDWWSTPLWIMRDFREEFAHVLDDRGEQRSLFDENTGTLTESQAMIWENYYQMGPDARRFWLLLAGCYLILLKVYISHFIDVDYSETMSGYAYDDNTSETAPKRENETNKTTENIYSQVPKEYIRPISKTMQKLFSGEIGSNTPPLKLEPHGSRYKISVAANIWPTDEHGEIITKSEILNAIEGLTAYDKEVYNAIGTLYDSHSATVTPQMIFRAMTGDEKSYLPPKSPQYEQIISSAAKMFQRLLVLDTAEKDRNGNARYCDLIPRRYVGPLLAGEFIEFGRTKINGYEVEGYFNIFRRPLLCEYSADIKQITKVPHTLFALPEKNHTRDAIIIKGTLFDRLRTMQNAKKNKNSRRKVSNRLLLETFYKLLEIPEGSTPALRKRRAYVRGIIKNGLDNWVKNKEIKAYNEITGARGAIIAIDVIL